MAQLMALQKFAHGATTIATSNAALYENDMHYDNKTTINKQILCRYFPKVFFRFLQSRTQMKIVSDFLVVILSVLQPNLSCRKTVNHKLLPAICMYIYIHHPFSKRFSYRQIYRYIYTFVFLHVRPCAFTLVIVQLVKELG